MTPIEEIAPVDLPGNWKLLPESITINDKVYPVWPKNGRGYILEEGDMKTQVIININKDNVLHASISNSLKDLSIEESMKYISDIIPSYFVDFIPQEVINARLASANINKRVAIGESRGLIKHFDKQL